MTHVTRVLHGTNTPLLTSKLAHEHPDTDHLEHQCATHQLTEHDDPGVPESWLDDASTPQIIEELERAC